MIVMMMIIIMDHCSRHDNDDDCKLVSGNELADLGPEAKGWLSAKYCIYPQVADLSGDLFRNDTPRKVLNLMHPFSQSVVLALPDRTIVEKIQV